MPGDWDTARKRLQRVRAEYFRVEIPDGPGGPSLLVISSAPHTGAAASSPWEAYEAAETAVLSVLHQPASRTDTKSGDSGAGAKRRKLQPVSSSRGWQPDRRRAGEYERLALTRDAEQAAASLREAGYQTESVWVPPRSPWLRRHRFRAPEQFDEEDTRRNAEWAAMLIRPPLGADGRPLDVAEVSAQLTEIAGGRLNQPPAPAEAGPVQQYLPGWENVAPLPHPLPPLDDGLGDALGAGAGGMFTSYESASRAVPESG